MTEALYWPQIAKIGFIECNSRKKKVWISQWQDLNLNATNYEQNDKNGLYKQGIAIRLGQCLEPCENRYSFALDFDGWNAVTAWFGGANDEETWNNVIEMAKKTRIEWHQDKSKLHMIMYSNRPIINKKIFMENAQLEVRCENNLLFAYPSIHKEGKQYTPLGTNEIAILTERDLLAMEAKIDTIAVGEGYMSDSNKSEYIAWLEDHNNWKSIGVGEGRHNALVILGCSYYYKYANGWRDMTDDQRKQKLWEMNLLFTVPKEEEEFDLIWKWIVDKHRKTRDQKHEKLNDDRKLYGDTIVAFPEHIQEKLGKNTFKIIGYNPLTLIVNDEYGKELVKSIIAAPKSKFDAGSSGNDDSESERTTTTTVSDTGTTKKTEVKTKSKLKYMPKNVIIDAAITNLVINENPLDKGSKTYKIIFAHKSGKKPFTIGPGNVSQIIQELQNRGRYVRTKDAVEGLSAILAELEDRADQEGGSIMTTINRKIPQPGYYYIPEIGNDIICNETTQQDIDPTTEEGRKKILDCIDVLEGLYNRNKHKQAFATVIRFSTIAPFGYAKKCMDTTGSNWLPNIDLWGFTRVGKNTLGRISLAIWRKNGHKDELIHSIGFTKADTEARLGIAVSKTSYQINVHEIGNLSEKKMQNISEMIKHITKSTNARGKYEQDGRYTDIPALSSIIFTSNDPPPQDPAFQVRVLPIHFTKNYATTAAQKKAFEIWFYTEKRIDTLGVLGDFITKYIILPNPEILKKDWLDLSKIILTKFYESVGKKPSRWFDMVSKEDVVEQSIEDAYFQLRGFFVSTIMDHYRKDFKIDPTETPKEIEDKLFNCLLFHTIPFMSLHDNQKGIAEIIITHNIIPELLKHNIESVTSMDALATELPGFKRGPKKVNGKTMKVVYGPYDDFKKFLNIDITETVRQTLLAKD